MPLRAFGVFRRKVAAAAAAEHKFRLNALTGIRCLSTFQVQNGMLYESGGGS